MQSVTADGDDQASTLSTVALMRAHRRSALAIATLALLYFVQALTWGNAIAPFDAPDEPEHFEMATFVADHGRWPVMTKDLGAHLLDETTHRLVPRPDPPEPSGWVVDPSHAYSLRHHYVAQPPFGYVGLTIGVRAARMMTMTLPGEAAERRDLSGARTAAALMGAIAVLAIGLAALRMRPHRLDLHLLAPAALALLPQFIFVGAYCNPDVLGFALCGVATWRLATGVARGWSVRQGAIFGACAAAALLAKASAVPVIAVLCATFLWTLYRGRGPRFRTIVATAIAAAVVALPWAYFLLTTYGFPPPWADPEFDRIAESLPDLPRLRLFDGSLSATRAGETWWSLLGGPWAVTSVKSSVGKFGWMDRPLHLWQYVAFLAVVAAAAFGALRSLLGAARTRAWPALSAVFVACALAGAAQVAASLNFSLVWDYQAQGRYLFPAVPGLALLAAFGLGHFGSSTGTRMTIAGVAIALAAVVAVTAYPLTHGARGN